MAAGWVLLAVSYLVGLFWLAKWGDKNTPLATRLSSHPVTYSLALAIYCTAWTFFGAVGEASRDSWQYLPILLGPFLVYVLGYRFIFKLTLVSKKQHINTIADFISSRYGKRQSVALLVTIIALLATIPYVALQLKAIGLAFQMVTEQANSELIILFAAVFIAIFSAYFGTQKADVTEYRRGLMLAIAFESSVKLIALIVVAVVAYFWSQSAQPQAFAQASESFKSFDSLSSFSFFAQTLMASAAIICLPRQFHVAVIDNLSLEHLRTSRWLFPLYLAITATVIPVIAIAGQALIGAQEPDTYVLSLAILSDSLIVKMLVFLGGLSAATAMIVIATLTLSTMVTNDVILPKMLARHSGQGPPANYARTILILRRVVICALLLLAYIYHQYLSNSRSLASIGLIAFSLVIQLLPSIVGGLYWKKGHAHGVYAGLLVGLFSWILVLLLPAFTGQETAQIQSAQISLGAILSLATNTIAYVLFSIYAQDRLIDRIQAQSFVNPREQQITDKALTPTTATVSDFVTLMATFLGESRSESLLEMYQKQSEQELHRKQPPDSQFLQFCEKAVGGVLGGSSAKALIENILSGKKLNFEEVVNLFDDTTQAIKFNTSALFASIESLDQGISVVDKELRLVAWNKRYLELFDYPDDMINVGIPIEELVRFNAQRGECGVGEIETLVQKRVGYMKAGNPHRFVRQRSDGKMIEMVGNPLPGGGFVTSFNDVTEHIELQKALRESNIDLTKRIEKRSEEVQAINAELRAEIERRAGLEIALVKARQVAEQANASKTRFLALASHDVLQPLNAAKLYLCALQEMPLEQETSSILAKLSDSVSASEALIATLLDIARLDQGEMKLSLEKCELRALLHPIIDEFAMRAQNKGLELRVRLADCWILTDKTYFHRIVQNLLSNAVKYTKTGKVLLSARKRGEQLLLQIWDTGIGISDSEQQRIFTDFYRVQDSNQHGVGLGLGVVSRLSEKLATPITVRSAPGKGSCFSMLVPITAGQTDKQVIRQLNPLSLATLRVLCVDDQAENLDAMQTLLNKWQVSNFLATDKTTALQAFEKDDPNVLLVDYHLAAGENGLDMIELIRKNSGKKIQAALVTAKQDDELIENCRRLEIAYLSKPVKPAKLKALLTSFRVKI